MSDYIPLSVPCIQAKEQEYVRQAIESTWLSTAGPLIKVFEEKLAKKVKVKDICALQSGTAALHLALILADVKANDEVLVPTLTFIGGVNPIKYLQAEAVFMDCTDNLCLDVDKVENFLENECLIRDNKVYNKSSNRQIKAIIATHIFGNMVDMQKLMPLAKKYHLKVIEDAAEALGSYCIKSSQYTGTFGDFGIYSFNGNKIITTGNGGALTAKKKEDVQKARYLANQAKDDTLYYTHNEVGYNYGMSNIQAGLGLGQLEQLEDFIKIKKENYLYYKEAGLKLLDFDKEINSNYWFYSLVTKNRDKLLHYLEEEKIQSRPLWKLIHTLKPYEHSQAYKIEKAYFYYEKILNIPCSVGIKKEEIERVIHVLKKAEALFS